MNSPNEGKSRPGDAGSAIRKVESGDGAGGKPAKGPTAPTWPIFAILCVLISAVFLDDMWRVAVALSPGIIAYLVQLKRKPYQALCILICNAAGATPLVLELFDFGSATRIFGVDEQSLMIVAFVWAWIGWLIDKVTPAGYAIFIKWTGQRRLAEIDRSAEKITDEWGRDVRDFATSTLRKGN